MFFDFDFPCMFKKERHKQELHSVYEVRIVSFFDKKYQGMQKGIHDILERSYQSDYKDLRTFKKYIGVFIFKV